MAVEIHVITQIVFYVAFIWSSGEFPVAKQFDTVQEACIAAKKGDSIPMITRVEYEFSPSIKECCDDAFEFNENRNQCKKYPEIYDCGTASSHRVQVLKCVPTPSYSGEAISG